MEQDSDRLSKIFSYREALAISPIVHPRRWGPGDPKLTVIPLSLRVHPLLGSILAPQVPRICLETSLSFFHYLQSGGHTVNTRKSLKPLLKSCYFTRLKMRPWLSRFQKRQQRHLNGTCLLDEGCLHSEWWGNHPERPGSDLEYWNRIRVPFRFFRYRKEYASNYDLWCTYQHTLQLLPIFLANMPPNSQLASVSATNCIFNSFCTAYPRETREAKKSIARYLSRCRYQSYRVGRQ